MNILIDLVPDSVDIGGEEVKINSDFRTSILFELLIQDESIPEEERLYLALKLYYENIPEDADIEQYVDRMLWFYRGGKTIEEIKIKGSSGKSNRIYDYDIDAEYIYSAFMEQYGIDLQDIEYLHWWKFKALFTSLNENTQMAKIMQYRSIDLNKIDNKEEKERYRKLKKIYELPKYTTEEEKELKELTKFLMSK